MTVKEFKSKVSEAADKEWWKTKESSFNFHYISYQVSFEGLTSLFEFVNQQVEGWSKYSEPIPSELNQSINYFNNIKSQLENFANSHLQQQQRHLENVWGNIISPINDLRHFPLPYNCPETDFLIKIFEQFGATSFQGAFHYLTGRITNNFNSNTDYFRGSLLAYEYKLKDVSEIPTRRNKEKTSLGKLRNDFQKYLTESDSQIVEHLSNTSAKYEEYVKLIDQFKTDKQELFDNWFKQSQDGFSEFDTTSKSKIEELEKTYREKLKLEEPAKYWDERATKLRRQGWFALVGLVLLVLITAWSLQSLLWKTPEQIYVSFFEGDKSAAIRWSIIYITFISFIAFAIRALTKVMFSSFHLARDSEERHTLTYFYLALLKDSKVDEKDKQLIMQSLFSRAETGLLKDDSSPTMPNDMVTKIFTKT